MYARHTLLGSTILVIALAFVTAVAADGFESADRAWSWNFPRDHGSHRGFQTEWWYFTGAARDEDGRRYGYELTFFRFALRAEAVSNGSSWRARDLILGHLALTDVDGERFYMEERSQRAAAGLAGAGEEALDVWAGAWRAQQLAAEDARQGHRFRLSAGDDDWGLELELQSTRAPILHGETGLSYKSADRSHASYYYSMPRLQTEGRLRVAGRELAVRGQTWMDHEFFTGSTPVNGLGWDWFSCRLEDGRDLMLYVLRHPDGERFASGTLVDEDGTARAIDTTELELEPLDWWSSPETGSRYPTRWRLSLPAEGARLEITATLPQQEIVATQSVGFAYWEGLSDTTGEWNGRPVRGEGYVELTGYPSSF